MIQVTAVDSGDSLVTALGRVFAEQAIGACLAAVAVVGRLILDIGIEHIINNLLKQCLETGTAFFDVLDRLLAEAERGVIIVGSGMLDEKESG